MAIATQQHRFGNGIRHRLENHPMACLTGLFVFCVMVFVATIPLPRVDGQLIGSDGVFYYSYLPTLLLDHDLQFDNQYAKLMPEKIREESLIAKAGLNFNKHGVGSAILWAPFFLVGHILALLLNAAGLRIAMDGTGTIYQTPTMIGSMTYGFFGVLLVYKSCSRFFGKLSSASAAISVWLATNLIYYMIAEPSMSHACSFFATALFLYAWLRFRPQPSLRQWILLGMAGGLVALVRLQDATWLALPFLEVLPTGRMDLKDRMRRQWKGFLVFGTAAGIVFMPQLAVWHILSKTGAYLPSAGGYFNWFAPEILKVLFSLRHGLFLWHPVLLPATAGLVLLYRRDRSLAVLSGLMFAVQVYVIGAWNGWWGGDSFGSRLLISSFPALALGLAALIDWAARRNALPAAGILICVFITWNALFFAQYRLDYISKSSAITFRQLTLGKVAMLEDISDRIRTLLHRPE